MAKYTLAINSARNADLLANLKWAAGRPQPDGVKPVLTEVIEAAETFETAKLRADALASIEELKRKGPALGATSRCGVRWARAHWQLVASGGCRRAG